MAVSTRGLMATLALMGMLAVASASYCYPDCATGYSCQLVNSTYTCVSSTQTTSTTPQCTTSPDSCAADQYCDAATYKCKSCGCQTYQTCDKTTSPVSCKLKDPVCSPACDTSYETCTWYPDYSGTYCKKFACPPCDATQMCNASNYTCVSKPAPTVTYTCGMTNCTEYQYCDNSTSPYTCKPIMTTPSCPAQCPYHWQYCDASTGYVCVKKSAVCSPACDYDHVCAYDSYYKPICKPKVTTPPPNCGSIYCEEGTVCVRKYWYDEVKYSCKPANCGSDKYCDYYKGETCCHNKLCCASGTVCTKKYWYGEVKYSCEVPVPVEVVPQCDEYETECGDYCCKHNQVCVKQWYGWTIVKECIDKPKITYPMCGHEYCGYGDKCCKTIAGHKNIYKCCGKHATCCGDTCCKSDQKCKLTWYGYKLKGTCVTKHYKKHYKPCYYKKAEDHYTYSFYYKLY